MPKKLTTVQLMDDVSRSLGGRKRFFQRNNKGHPVGDGLEVVDKTSKSKPYKNLATQALTKVFIHRLADGRTIRYTVEIEGKSKPSHRAFPREVPGRSS